MSELSEEEIIKKVDNFLDGERLYNTKTGETIIPYEYGECTRFVSKEYYEALQGLLDLYQKEKQKNTKAIEMLQEHIKHCEQEAKGSLNNKICHIALKFDKHLLKELLEERN